MSSTRPVYAFIGSTYEGGGLAVGPGYRRTYGDSGTINAYAAVSVKNYRAAELSVGLPELARGRVTIRLNGRYLDAPEVAFYGATEDDRRTFEYTTASVGAVARVQAAKRVAFGGGFDLVTSDAGSPFGAVAPRVDPTYGQARAFVEVDTRTTPGYTTQRRLLPPRLHRLPRDRRRALHVPAHGRRRAAVHPVHARQLGDRAARPRLDDRRPPTATRCHSSCMPALGGRTLRGYSSWRFRDRNRVLLTGEYRWAAGPFVDMAVFVDAGSVAPRLDEIDLGKLAHVARRRPHVPHDAPDRVPHGSGALQRRSRAGVLLQPPFLTLAFESRGSRP